MFKSKVSLTATSWRLGPGAAWPTSVTVITMKGIVAAITPGSSAITRRRVSAARWQVWPGVREDMARLVTEGGAVADRHRVVELSLVIACSGSGHVNQQGRVL